MIFNHQARTIIAIAITSMLVGCSMFPRQALTIEKLKKFVNIEVNSNEAIGVNDDPDKTTYDVDTQYQDIFIIKPVVKNYRLPDKQIKNLSFNDTSLSESLNLMLDGTSISLSVHDAAAENQNIYGSVVNFNFSGNLPDVIENLSNSIGFFYNYNNNILSVYPDEKFIVTLPPLIGDDIFAGIANTVTKMGGMDVYLDRQNRTLFFRANKTATDAINGYLEYFRSTRSMIVYDTFIYQVELTDSNQTGIDWTRLGVDVAAAVGGIPGKTAAITMSGVGGGSAISSAQGLGFNAVYESNKLSMGALLTFLQSQGNVKTIAQPKMAIISGSKGTFKVGSETNYVSKVGTNTTTATNQTTLETAKVVSGLTLGISGDIHDGTIYTRINMILSELLQFNLFQALGTQINLPQTANRELGTTVRARSGDMVLLAGINNSKESSNISGLPGGQKAVSMTTRNDSAIMKSELVIIMKPKIINFTSKKQNISKTDSVTITPVIKENIEYKNDSYVPSLNVIKKTTESVTIEEPVVKESPKSNKVEIQLLEKLSSAIKQKNPLYEIQPPIDNNSPIKKMVIPDVGKIDQLDKVKSKDSSIVVPNISPASPVTSDLYKDKAL